MTKKKEMYAQMIGVTTGMMLAVVFISILVWKIPDVVPHGLPANASEAIIITDEEYNNVRRDLIPYGECVCNDKDWCFCYPI